MIDAVVLSFDLLAQRQRGGIAIVGVDDVGSRQLKIPFEDHGCCPVRYEKRPVISILMHDSRESLSLPMDQLYLLILLGVGTADGGRDNYERGNPCS
jgi:hypothetical protein